MADAQAQLAVETHSGGLAVFGDGAFILEQHVGNGLRAFIHPIQAPGGAGVLTEDAPGHHPWQHGFYIGLNDVNGVGFWSEGLHPLHGADDGGFSSRLDGRATVESGAARWCVATEYLDRQSQAMFGDRQNWELRMGKGRLSLDLTWTLRAKRDLVFGEHDYGGLFLRMPYRKLVGGSAFDSEGQNESGRRARWVAVQLALPETGRQVQAAVLDHPGNPGSPVIWRIDNELGIGPSPSAAGSWGLAEAEETTFRYRLVAFPEPTDSQKVEDLWQDYAQGST